MKVLIVANDRGPSAGLKLVAEKLGDEATSHLFEEMPTENIAEFDAVLVGMSCSPEASRMELEVIKMAYLAGVPFGLFADTFGVWNRLWFADSDILENARFLFVINEEEAKQARAVFPNAKVVASGNPAWESYSFPKFSRQQMRKKFGVAEDEVLILAPGGNMEPAINILFFGSVIQAAYLYIRHYLKNGKVKVFISPHPADKEKVSGFSNYRDLMKFSAVPVLISDMPTSDLIPGVGVIIDMFSSIAIEAGYQGKPVINFFNDFSLAKLAQLTGRRTWPPCDEMGISWKVENGDMGWLAKSIFLILNPEIFKKTRQVQMELLPTPKQGESVAKIIATLKEFA